MESELNKICPLFAGVEDDQLDALLDCLSALTRRYSKDEYVFRRGERARSVGVVIEGGVHVIQEDVWGNRALLAHIGPGGLFGEAFSCAGTESLPVSVVATEDSEILLIDYRKIITVCSSSCVFHTLLISNMLRILASKNIQLTSKMEFISQRTTREKILAFLSAQAIEAQSKSVVIPFNRQEMADYLGVDRSALSRELSQMKKEGLLNYDKDRFDLKD